MGARELSKAARNEKRKITATYVNNLAVALLIAGAVAPYYAVLSMPVADYMKALENIGTADGPRLTTVAAFIASWVMSGLLHWTARSILEDVED